MTQGVALIFWSDIHLAELVSDAAGMFHRLKEILNELERRQMDGSGSG